MLGYVVPEKPELKVREYELYSAYYCGICKSIEKRYGQLPRMTLNYDSVFLALIISSQDETQERLSTERCPVHPLKKRLIVHDQIGIDYAADIMLLLAYFKAKDDQQDDSGLKGATVVALLRPYYKKILKSHQEKGIMIEDCLNELSILERERCPSLDRAAEPFAKLMEEVFAAEWLSDRPNITAGLRSMGYHLGKWITLIDAFDDLDENRADKNYNPLIAQFGEPQTEADEDAWRDQIAVMTERNLLFYLAGIADAWEGIQTEKNKGLIENIIYLGLLRKTEQVLRKGTIENAEPI
ncbi:MAG: hypothetical protein CVU86_05450 [Firmicutes bacterium HGW-Firmicutes-11]|jgi:hypothetical protein|nr:MAG: hypothetical protein CVU86_05450 [Firmicutes bacterium HGW-Firmicutes-11]